METELVNNKIFSSFKADKLLESRIRVLEQ